MNKNTQYSFRYPDILRKDSLPMDILSNGQFDERTFRRKDILPKGQHAENRGMFGTVTHFVKMFRVVTHYFVDYVIVNHCVK